MICPNVLDGDRASDSRRLGIKIPDNGCRTGFALRSLTDETNLSFMSDRLPRWTFAGRSRCSYRTHRAHAARIVPRLVELGVVERREVPPAVLVRLVPDNLAARLLLALADLRHALLDELRKSAHKIEPSPANVTLFGSFARGDGDAVSDLDVVVVRPSAVSEDDAAWSESIARWEAHGRRVSGNAVNRIEVREDEVPRLMRSRRLLWQTIRREGITLQGQPLEVLGIAAGA